MAMKVSRTVAAFDDLPDSALATIKDAGLVLGRCRATVESRIKDGSLSIVRAGRSVRIRVGDIRKLLAGEATK